MWLRRVQACRGTVAANDQSRSPEQISFESGWVKSFGGAIWMKFFILDLFQAGLAASTAGGCLKQQTLNSNAERKHG
jgi:hypothetical protein